MILIVRKTGFINWLKWAIKPSKNMFYVDFADGSLFSVGDYITNRFETHGPLKVLMKINK